RIGVLASFIMEASSELVPPVPTMPQYDGLRTVHHWGGARMLADSTERVHLSVAEARALSEGAMRGIGYDPEEARILADHVIDAALCGYEYSGLPKLLNVADHPRLRSPRGPMRALKETSVSVLFDG